MRNDDHAKNFEAEIRALQSDEDLKKHQRYFKFVPDDESSDDYFIGVRMGSIFELAKQHTDMPAVEIEKLLESPVHEIRVGALSIMGQCAKSKKCTPERLKELSELYLRRHDRINNWDLVDLAAYYVVGKYLADKPKDVLYRLARSKNQWERRSAIVATAHFILKQKQVDDTFAIAELLVDDKEDLVNKGTGYAEGRGRCRSGTAARIPHRARSHDAAGAAAIRDREIAERQAGTLSETKNEGALILWPSSTLILISRATPRRRSISTSRFSAASFRP